MTVHSANHQEPTESASEVSVEYTLKPSDVYTPFQWSKQNLVSYVAVFLLWYGVYDLCFSRTAYLKRLPEDSSVSAIVVLVSILISFGLFIFPYLRMLSMFRGSPALRRPRRLTFSADGLHIESQDSRGDYKWSLFLRVVETRTLFLFMMTTHAAMYVPKRYFRSHDDIEAVRKMIRENFKGKWRLRRD